MKFLARFQKPRRIEVGPPPGMREPYALTHSSSGFGAWDTLDGMVFGASRLPGSDQDWAREVGDITINYVIAGCLRWMADNVGEPELVVERRDTDGEWKKEPYHPLLDLLLQPNDAYDGESLLTAAMWDDSIVGRGYWIKERDNLDRLKRLWWVPWYTIKPRAKDATVFLSDYLYRPAGQGRDYSYKPKDVVHFRWGLDYETGGRLGVHRTRPFLPAVSALNEGAVYTPSILRNMGIVPNVLMVRGTVSPEARQGLRDWFRSLFTRDNRGAPGVLEVAGDGTGGVGDIKQLGLSPEDLALDVILNRPEIAACLPFGIHPGVLYLGNAGGKGFDNGGQLKEARRASYHDCLIPRLKRFARTITRSLLSEFEIDGPNQVRCRFDFGDVEALQEDAGELYTRNTVAVEGGWMRVSEAREKAKLKVEESDKVYLRKPGVTAVEEADEAPEAPEQDPLSGTPADGGASPSPANEEGDD